MSATGRVTRLPPRRGQVEGLEDVELLAWLLDNSIPIPGTARRIGLDAIVGLIPGLGDVVTGAIGILIVVRGAQRGLPRVAVARMLTNLALDLAVGAIPVLGDAWDLWFKAHARNLAILRRHAVDPTASTSGHWLFFVALAIAAIAAVAAAYWLAAALIGLIAGGGAA